MEWIAKTPTDEAPKPWLADAQQPPNATALEAYSACQSSVPSLPAGLALLFYVCMCWVGIKVCGCYSVSFPLVSTYTWGSTLEPMSRPIYDLRKGKKKTPHIPYRMANSALKCQLIILITARSLCNYNNIFINFGHVYSMSISSTLGSEALYLFITYFGTSPNDLFSAKLAMQVR